MAFQKTKGTSDMFPEEKSIQSKVFNSLGSVARRYGFLEVESPAMENMETLTKKSGEEIRSQIFTLEKRSKEELGLRFDLTVPLARMFIQKQKEITKPAKWFYLTRMWRYEQPQKGRLREFYQFGVEIFGSSSPKADAQMISVAVDGLRELGLTKDDFFVKLNNRKLLQGLLESITDKDTEELIRIIDKRSKIGDKNFIAELKDLGLGEDEIREICVMLKLEVSEIEKHDMNALAKEGYEELKSVLRYMGGRSGFVKIDLSTARGLAYYTGTVFEIFDTDEKFRSIAGGGRYDELVGLFGGESAPATGFGMGYSTLQLLLEDKGLVPAADLSPEYYVVIMDGADDKSMQIIDDLRKSSTVEHDIMGRTMSKQMKYANSIGAEKVIFIGPEELQSGMLTIKDMRNGNQEKKRINEITSS